MSDVVGTLNLQNTGAYLFPSSSTDGKGKLFTESNTRDITEKIQTRNYKELKTDFVFNGSNNTISSGVAVINGYKIYIPNSIDISNDLGNLQSNKTYDVSINIAKQDSTDGWIADSSNNGGVVYIAYTEVDNSKSKNIADIIEKSISIGDEIYKVAINRLNDKNANNITTTEYFSENYKDETLPVVDDNNCRFSSSLWVINRLNGLFVIDTNEISVSDIDFNAMYNSGIRNDPTLKLTIGSITTGVEQGTVTIESVETYNCTQRIDIDSLFVGDSTLSEYLATIGGLVKTYGSNTITSIRDTSNDYSVGGTGQITEVPFIATVDSLFYKYNNNYDTDYMYVPYTYTGESYNEIECFDYDSSKVYQAGDIVKYEVSSVYKYYKCKVNETVGELPTNIDYWEEIERPFESDDVTDLQSIIECSFNSVPTTDNFSGTPYGSQILSIASYNDCYTKYSYNILQRIYNGVSIDTKQCSLNEYRIGMYNPSNYLELSNVSNKISPPFGIYSNGAFALIKNEYKDSTQKFDLVELQGGVVRLDSAVVEINKSSVSDYDGETAYTDSDLIKNNNLVWISSAVEYSNTSTYNQDDIVVHSHTIYKCTTTISTPENWDSNKWTTDLGDFDVNYWEVVYIQSGNIFEVNSDSSKFNLYSGARVINSVGFKNDTNKAVIEFNNGTKTSQIGISDSNDSNDKPIIEFSDNVNVDGYVRANRVYNAVYNDYAEWYNSNNAGKVYEGDIIYYNQETDSYENYSDNPATVIGVCSEKYGMIVGGKDIPNMEENRKDFIPVSLCGRVKVRLCNNDCFKCGDYVYADGSSVGMISGEHKIGKFLKYIDENYGIMQVFLA